MPKKTKNQIPAAPAAPSPPRPLAPSTPDVPGLRYVTIRIPVLAGQPGYATDRIDMRLLRPAEPEAYKAVLDGLHASHATLADGRHVDTGPEAIRWILQQISQQGTGNGERGTGQAAE